ncbi:Cellulose synthase-like protein G1 [Vitis vinifera]|uniref:Cellulose synthase-like protein G1 n=1 Tax=Vitis vinifera TaxID=29760 RepID=A0A438I4F2_VITVI|nr:Cellulose synthase-like protein G1 [Vitis vinifera]
MGGGGLTDQSQCLPLHTRALPHHTSANRVFAVVYLCAILALLYHHFLALLHTTTVVSLLFLLADAVLAFMWATAQAFRMCPTQRQVFIEHLQHVAKESDYPALDVFICTADPYKEPPISVVNTALSVMAYDYPTEKLSVYVSDDGGSQLTLFAFMEAARFATHWLPYCRKNKILERCPEAYFESNPSSWFPEADQIKLMYENMRVRVETAVKSGIISHDYINSKQELEAFIRWTDGFTSQNHPAVIQVLLECGKDEDVMGHTMPNLVYVSRGKSINLPQNFKAGALNALLRVSATMTNAPVILTLDSNMYSNDPQTPLRALCYLLDPSMDPKLAYVQFPQIFYGINKNDIYGGEARHVFQIHPTGMDGLKGPIYLGSKSIKSREILASAHHVADCNFESQSQWGIKMGFRYGSLVEDMYTSYMLQCEGWKSIFCHPKRPAFLPQLALLKRVSQSSPRSQNLEVVEQPGGVDDGGVLKFRILFSRILAQIHWHFPIRIQCDKQGISPYGFNVTSKVVDEEQSKRYNQGEFEFGVPSPLFLPLATAAILNLIFLTGFAVVNCCRLYEAMLRTDEGKMPANITLISIVLAWALYLASSMAFF